MIAQYCRWIPLLLPLHCLPPTGQLHCAPQDPKYCEMCWLTDCQQHIAPFMFHHEMSAGYSWSRQDKWQPNVHCSWDAHVEEEHDLQEEMTISDKRNQRDWRSTWSAQGAPRRCVWRRGQPRCGLTRWTCSLVHSIDRLRARRCFCLHSATTSDSLNMKDIC